MKTHNKSKFIPHESWIEECQVVYFINTGIDCWIAVYKNEFFTSGPCSFLMPYQTSIDSLSMPGPQTNEIRELINRATIMWTCEEKVTKKKIKLIDRGSYFETMEV